MPCLVFERDLPERPPGIVVSGPREPEAHSPGRDEVNATALLCSFSSTMSHFLMLSCWRHHYAGTWVLNWSIHHARRFSWLDGEGAATRTSRGISVLRTSLWRARGWRKTCHFIDLVGLLAEVRYAVRLERRYLFRGCVVSW